MASHIQNLILDLWVGDNSNGTGQLSWNNHAENKEYNIYRSWRWFNLLVVILSSLSLGGIQISRD